jgi:hypothetical protein
MWSVGIRDDRIMVAPNALEDSGPDIVAKACEEIHAAPTVAVQMRAQGFLMSTRDLISLTFDKKQAEIAPTDDGTPQLGSFHFVSASSRAFIRSQM